MRDGGVELRWFGRCRAFTPLPATLPASPHSPLLSFPHPLPRTQITRIKRYPPQVAFQGRDEATYRALLQLAPLLDMVLISKPFATTAENKVGGGEAVGTGVGAGVGAGGGG